MSSLTSITPSPSPPPSPSKRSIFLGVFVSPSRSLSSPHTNRTRAPDQLTQPSDFVQSEPIGKVTQAPRLSEASLLDQEKALYKPSTWHEPTRHEIVSSLVPAVTVDATGGGESSAHQSEQLLATSAIPRTSGIANAKQVETPSSSQYPHESLSTASAAPKRTKKVIFDGVVITPRSRPRVAHRRKHPLEMDPSGSGNSLAAALSHTFAANQNEQDELTAPRGGSTRLHPRRGFREDESVRDVARRPRHDGRFLKRIRGEWEDDSDDESEAEEWRGKLQLRIRFGNISEITTHVTGASDIA